MLILPSALSLNTPLLRDDSAFHWPTASPLETTKPSGSPSGVKNPPLIAASPLWAAAASAAAGGGLGPGLRTVPEPLRALFLEARPESRWPQSEGLPEGCWAAARVGALTVHSVGALPPLAALSSQGNEGGAESSSNEQLQIAAAESSTEEQQQ